MTTKRTNGWNTRNGKAIANKDDHTITASRMTWNSFTKFHQQLRDPNQGGNPETKVTVVQLRKAGETAQPEDRGFHLVIRKQGQPDHIMYILPPVEESQNPRMDINHLTQAVSPAVVLEGGPAARLRLPLDRWTLAEDATSAYSESADMRITIKQQSYTEHICQSAISQDLVTGPEEADLFRLVKEMQPADEQQETQVFTIVIYTGNEESARTLVIIETASTKTVKAFTELHRPIDLYSEARRSAVQRLQENADWKWN